MVQILVSGILVGGIYGLIALGLNLIMGVMGIVNFAHGPLLMVGMYISYWLWTVAGLDPYLALPIVAVSLFAMGWLFQRLAIRPLLQTRVGAEELPSLLLTAGLMMFLNNMALILFGPNYKTIHPSYKNNLFQMGMLRINGIRAINFLIALVLTSVFFLVLKHTDIGKKMRATAQDRESATVIGIDTDHIYNIVTATGFALAGIAGGLLLPISYTYPMVGEIFTMKSFIIIVLGGLGNLTGALVGGLAMGVAETVITQYLGAAMTQVFFLMLFVVVILFRPAGLFGKRLTDDGVRFSQRNEPVGFLSHKDGESMFSKRQLLKGGLWLIGILILTLLPFIMRNAYHLQVLIMLFWYAYLAICWNWVGGFAGQFSMIHGTFVGVGGYTSTLLFLNFGLTPFIGMVLGGVLATLLSIIVSYPCFRLRGIYFALSTMASGLSIQILFINTYSVWGIKINGADGLSIPPRDSFVLFQSTSKVPYYLVILALLVGVLALSAGIRHSKLGYYLTAINENQESAESLGINSSRYKLMAFMISAFFSAIGGTFYAQLMLIIDPGRIMGIDFSIELALMSILGGMQSIWGPLLGASIIVPTSEYLRAFLGSKYAGSHLAIYGLMLMVMVIYFPRGLSEFINIGITRIRTALGESEPVI